MQSVPDYSAPSSRAFPTWAEDIIAREAAVVSALDAALDEAVLSRIVLAAFLSVFSTDIQLGRLTTLRDRLATVELPRKIQTIITRSRDSSYLIRDVALRELYNSTAKDVFGPLKSGVANYLVVNTVRIMKMEPLTVPSNVGIGLEAPDVAKERGHLKRKIDRLDAARQEIEAVATQAPVATLKPALESTGAPLVTQLPAVHPRLIMEGLQQPSSPSESSTSYGKGSWQNIHHNEVDCEYLLSDDSL